VIEPYLSACSFRGAHALGPGVSPPKSRPHPSPSSAPLTNSLLYRFLWGIALLPLGVDTIPQDLNVLLIVPPQLFALLSWGQYLYYGSVACSCTQCTIEFSGTLVLYGLGCAQGRDGIGSLHTRILFSHCICCDPVYWRGSIYSSCINSKWLVCGGCRRIYSPSI